MSRYEWGDTFSTVVAAISPWASTNDETIRQEHLAGFAIELLHRLLEDVSVRMSLLEDVLSNLRLLTGGSPPETVEAELEPVIDFAVELVILRAEF